MAIRWPKFTQIRIFGLKTPCHLATPVVSRLRTVLNRLPNYKTWKIRILFEKLLFDKPRTHRNLDFYEPT
jgi:hypothetical protein